MLNRVSTGSHTLKFVFKFDFIRTTKSYTARRTRRNHKPRRIRNCIPTALLRSH